MAVLRRCQESDREELNYWKRRYNENTEMRKTGSELVSRQHSPGSADSLSNGKGRVSLKMVLDGGVRKTQVTVKSVIKCQGLRTWNVQEIVSSTWRMGIFVILMCF